MRVNEKLKVPRGHHSVLQKETGKIKENKNKTKIISSVLRDLHSFTTYFFLFDSKSFLVEIGNINYRFSTKKTGENTTFIL